MGHRCGGKVLGELWGGVKEMGGGGLNDKTISI